MGGEFDAVTGKRCTFAYPGIGARRRLYSPPGRDRRSRPAVSDRTRRGVLMLVKRFADAKPYEAPNHRGVVGLRLQGFEEGGPANQWVGLSQYLPGGGAGPDATPFEKVYVVLD